MQLHLPHGQAQRVGMRFLAHGISAVNAHREKFRQAELAQLTSDTIAIAAGDQAKIMSVAQSRQDPARTGDQLRPVLCIMPPPRAVCIFPAPPRQPRSAINLIPVRRIVFLELGDPPRDVHLLEHCQVRRCIGVVGIDKCAIPVEQDSFNARFAILGHRSRE